MSPLCCCMYLCIPSRYRGGGMLWELYRHSFDVITSPFQKKCKNKRTNRCFHLCLVSFGKFFDKRFPQDSGQERHSGWKFKQLTSATFASPMCSEFTASPIVCLFAWSAFMLLLPHTKQGMLEQRRSTHTHTHTISTQCSLRHKSITPFPY